MVIDPKGYAPRSRYYAIGRIDPALNIYYSVSEACLMALKHDHYGPWEGVDAPGADE